MNKFELNTHYYLIIACLTGGSIVCAQAFAEPDSEEDPSHLIRLESTITGDKEQPAVSYFIPWQDVGTPDKLQWNIDKKHDNTLDLIDRDVMLRSMRVYTQMNVENPPSE